MVMAIQTHDTRTWAASHNILPGVASGKRSGWGFHSPGCVWMDHPGTPHCTMTRRMWSISASSFLTSLEQGEDREMASAQTDTRQHIFDHRRIPSEGLRFAQ